jgi:hypothetical protein
LLPGERESLTAADSRFASLMQIQPDAVTQYIAVESADWDADGGRLVLEPNDEKEAIFLDTISERFQYLAAYGGRAGLVKVIDRQSIARRQTRVVLVRFVVLQDDFTPQNELRLGSLTPNDLAALRVRRILLNESDNTADNLSSTFEIDRVTRELFISRVPGAPLSVESSKLPALYKEFGRHRRKFLEIAWIDSIARLVFSGAVASVSSLELTLLGRSVQVAFRGTRRKHAAHLSWANIRVDGYCRLVTDEELTRESDSAYSILERGVEYWNDWRREHPDATPKLSGVNLTSLVLAGCNLERVKMQRANLSRADLTNANLRYADLERTDFRETNLKDATLRDANLKGADLSGASLQDADLSGADLTGTNLSAALLDGADFSLARTAGTNLTAVDLSNSRGLEGVVHEGPSSIGIDTVYKSNGKIPEVFLRGAGVPEEFIVYIRSMMVPSIEYYSCFISYSTRDQSFVDRLYSDLQANGVRCWFAPHDIMGGRKIHEQIDAAIRVHDKLLLILSEHSMASDWVGTEIANAREHEAREKKQLLFPITIAPFEEVKQWKKFDADRGTDSAREIREYYIPDFSGWEQDHAAYQREFEKLVNALKAGSNP